MKVVVKKTYWLTKTESLFLKSCYGVRPLARLLNMSVSYLCDIINRKRPISAKYVKQFKELLEVVE